MVARARILPRGLILQLRAVQLLAVELIPRDGRNARRDDGSVPLPVRGDEELHGVVAGEDERPLDAVVADDGLGGERTWRPLRARLLASPIAALTKT